MCPRTNCLCFHLLLQEPQLDGLPQKAVRHRCLWLHCALLDAKATDFFRLLKNPSTQGVNCRAVTSRCCEPPAPPKQWLGMAGTQCKALRASGMVNCGHFIGCEGRPTQFQELSTKHCSGQAVFSLDNRPHIVLGNEPLRDCSQDGLPCLVLGVLLPWALAMPAPVYDPGLS